MEYQDMINKVKALAAKNRDAKTSEEKEEVRSQMNALKEADSKAFAVAVGYLAKETKEKVISTKPATKTWGGARTGAGRKKKCVKRLYFSASQEVLDALANIEGNQSDFINECILKAVKEK